MAEMAVETLRFAAFATAAKVAFWQALGKRKLEHWRLDDSAQAIRGVWRAAPALGMPPRLELTAESLDAAFNDDGFKAEGEIRTLNSLADFAGVDKNALLKAAAMQLAEAIDSGRAVDDPSLLVRFVALCFADHKQNRYVSWFGFPALTAKPAASHSNRRGLQAFGGIEGLHAALVKVFGDATRRGLLFRGSLPKYRIGRRPRSQSSPAPRVSSSRRCRSRTAKTRPPLASSTAGAANLPAGPCATWSLYSRGASGAKRPRSSACATTCCMALRGRIVQSHSRWTSTSNWAPSTKSAHRAGRPTRRAASGRGPWTWRR